MNLFLPGLLQVPNKTEFPFDTCDVLMLEDFFKDLSLQDRFCSKGEIKLKQPDRCASSTLNLGQCTLILMQQLQMPTVKNAKQSLEGAGADTAASRDKANTSICVRYGHFLHNPPSAERINVTQTHAYSHNSLKGL